MRNTIIVLILVVLMASCGERHKAIRIMKKSIANLDTVETIYYKQLRSKNFVADPDFIRESSREYFIDRLRKDKLAGAKVHILYKVKDVVVNQDIYDGNKLIRKNNNYNYAAVYDFKKYPELKENNNYWNIYTPENTKRVLKALIKNKGEIDISMIQLDTAYTNDFTAIRFVMDNLTVKPGTEKIIQDYPGYISTIDIYFDKKNYFPSKIRTEWFHKSDTAKVLFSDEFNYGMKFNYMIVDSMFHTRSYVLQGYEFGEMKP